MLLKYFLVFLMLEPLTNVLRQQNNVCKTFWDYYFSNNNKNCFYDLDATLETTEIIKKYARKVEVHEVTSEDGYILKLFRIPRNDSNKVILLHHSIATYSHIYLFEGNNSLAMTLWHRGYDVWLANQRGTYQSDKHTKLDNNSYEYWDFSFHEMALYDVTAELELIREKTNNSQVIYFGHSLGSTIGLVYATLKPEEAAKYLKTMVLLAPASSFHYATSPVIKFANIAYDLMNLTNLNHLGSFLFFVPSISTLSRFFLRLFPFFQYLTNVIIWATCGYTPAETNPMFFNYDAVIYANNFSVKTLTHFIQLIISGCFQMFDYGTEKNLEIYGNKIPPLYQPNLIKVPTLLVSSYNDSLVSVKDNELLFDQLTSNVTIYGHWKLNGINHLDYHIGLHRKEIFANKLLEFLETL